VTRHAQFDFNADAWEDEDALITALTTPIAPTWLVEDEPGPVTWNEQGEPGSYGCFTVGGLLAAYLPRPLLRGPAQKAPLRAASRAPQVRPHTLFLLETSVNKGDLLPRGGAAAAPGAAVDALRVLEALHEHILPLEAAQIPWRPMPVAYSSTVPACTACSGALLSNSARALWGQLLRAVAPRIASTVRRGAAGVAGAAGAAARDAEASSATAVLQVTVWVYLRRLIFELIADDKIAVLFEAMAPAFPVRRTEELSPLPTPTFVSHSSTSERAEDYAWTLAGIMKAQEHCGYPPAVQPHGLALQLKEYQLQTLQWMTDMESLEHGVNALFWEQRAFAPGQGAFYYAPRLGELRLEAPPVRRGGILSEEMGLGKTVEIIALILAQRAAARARGAPTPAERDARAARGEFEGGTLIVVPSHLVSQWVQEIDKALDSTRAGLTLKVHTSLLQGFHDRCRAEAAGAKDCEGRACPNRDEAGRHVPGGHLAERIRARLSGADIVVTTYKTVVADRGAFKRVCWERVILDEMQEVRSSATDVARTCNLLRSEARWMVSGTPLYESIDDLNGELAFLGVFPFCLDDAVDGFWALRVRAPFEARDPAALDRLAVLLRAVMIRHSKSQTYRPAPDCGDAHTPRSILELPAASTRRVRVPLSPAEEYVYKFLEVCAVADVQTAGGGGSDDEEAGARDAPVQPALGSKAVFWEALLRQCCISPMLLNGGSGCHSQIKELDRRLRDRLRDRMLSGALSAEEQYPGMSQRIRSLTVEQAISTLMEARHVSETARHHKGNHMVRHDNTHTGVYDRSRTYAMPTIDQRLNGDPAEGIVGVRRERANAEKQTVRPALRAPRSAPHRPPARYPTSPSPSPTPRRRASGARRSSAGAGLSSASPPAGATAPLCPRVATTPWRPCAPPRASRPGARGGQVRGRVARGARLLRGDAARLPAAPLPPPRAGRRARARGASGGMARLARSRA